MAVSLDKRLWVPVGIGVLALLSGVVVADINPMVVHAVAGTSICVYIAITWYRDPPTEA